MISNSLSLIERKFSTIKCYYIGSDRFSRKFNGSDYDTIVIGITLFYGVILDYNAMFCSKANVASNRGRIMKHAIDGWPSTRENLFELLSSLDELGDLLLNVISSIDGFKVHQLQKELKTWSVAHWLCPLKGSVICIVNDLISSHCNGGEVQVIKMLRQISCFLKKLDVNRQSLQDDNNRNFFEFEDFLTRDVPRRLHDEEYLKTTSEMREILKPHISDFTVSPFVPGHGPGAVSDVDVKCWYDKHTHSSKDIRIAYLLDHASLGEQSDYLPLIRDEKSTRTSRCINVPKTWKRLRGISAEPPELQFWQQGVREAIDRMFTTDEWWASRINLHSQQRSRSLALSSSMDGRCATIDLSNASDSVTLQLIFDLFGNTELARWLVGTRSTHSLCQETTIRLQKFAPMGSSTCFPVECMVFIAAAQLAVSRTRSLVNKDKTVCVYGDDIILPAYASQELYKILSVIGFSVNTEKSFTEGEFREACGVEAWRGTDIAPCRFRSWADNISELCITHAEISSQVSFANELFVRGLHDTRQFLLEKLLMKRIQLGNDRHVSVQKTLFATFSGEGSTLISPDATNFNLEWKCDRSLQTLVCKRIVWRLRSIVHNLDSEMSESYSMCEYTAWLIRHQTGYQDYEKIWEKGWIDTMDINPYARLPLGTRMVPTFKWVLPVSQSFMRY